MSIRVQKLTAILAVSIFLLSLLAPQAYAHQMLTGTGATLPQQHQATLNLSSTQAHLGAHLGHSTSVNINVGGVTQTVNASSSLTAAERVAVHQVLTSGHQSLILGALGNAIGGTFTITPGMAQHITNLVIPQGVTAIANLGSAGLNLKGNLIDAGTLLAVSSQLGVTVANISAANIVDKQGGLITTVLPASGLAGYTNLNSALSLNLNAFNNIINAGTISSAGNLSLNAGQSIVNASGGSGRSLASVPTLQAANSINLSSGSGNITNAGIISATTGNINLASQATQSLAINNSGTLQALAGSINLRDPSYTGNANVVLTGGNLLSNQLNLYSGNGNITVDADQISGTVNAQGNAVHVTANSGELTLGSINLTGDPTFYSTDATNGITLGGNITSGEALSIVSAGNITASTDLTITTTGSTGFDINLVAGANITSSTGTASSTVGPGSGTSSSWSGTGTPAGPITISASGGVGGNIDFSNHNVTISTGTNAGGNIRLIAFANGGTGGQVLLSSGSSITATGSGGGTDGNVTIIAGATGSGTVISTGTITTTGGGAVTIANAAPTFKSGTSMTFNADGSIADGNDFKAGTPGTGTIQVNSNVSADGALTLTGSVSVGSSLTAQSNNVVTINIPSGGTLTNNGAIQSNMSVPSGTTTILVSSAAGDLNLFGNSGAFVQAGAMPGNTVFSATGNINLQDGTTLFAYSQNGGGSVLFFSPQIQVGSTDTVAATAFITAIGISGYTINSTTGCTSCPVGFQVYGNATSGALELLGAPVATGATSSATSNPVSNITIGANFNLYSDNSITLNSTSTAPATSTIVNISGQISSYPVNPGGSVTIQSPGNLTIVGSGQIQTNGTGSVSFLAMGAGKSLTIGDSTGVVTTNLSTANVGTVNFRTPDLIFAGTGAATPSFAAYPGTTATAINIDSGNSASVVNMTITLPSGSLGPSVSTSDGGSITIAPTGNGSLTFALSGAIESPITFNGAPLIINDNSAVTLNTGTSVYSDHAFIINMNAATSSPTPTLTNNGFIVSSGSGAGTATILVQNTLGNLNLGGTGGFVQYGTTPGDTVIQASGNIAFANNTSLSITATSPGSNVVFVAPQLLVSSTAHGTSSVTFQASGVNQYLLNSSSSCTSCPLTFGLTGTSSSGTLEFDGAPLATATTNPYTNNPVSDITIQSGLRLSSDTGITLNTTPTAPNTSTTVTINGTVSALQPASNISIAGGANLTLAGSGSLRTSSSGSLSITTSGPGTTSLNITSGSNLKFGFGAVQINATQISIPQSTTISSHGDIVATTSQFTNNGTISMSNNNLNIAPTAGTLTIAGSGTINAAGIIIGAFGGFNGPVTPTASLISYSGSQSFSAGVLGVAFSTVNGGTVLISANSTINSSAPAGLVFDTTNLVNNGTVNELSCGCSGTLITDSISAGGINISGTGTINSEDGIQIEGFFGPISIGGTQNFNGLTQVLDNGFYGVNILSGAKLTAQGIFIGTNALSNQGTITSTGTDFLGYGIDVESGPRGLAVSGPGTFIATAGGIGFTNVPGSSRAIQFSGSLTLSAPSIGGFYPAVSIYDLADKGVIFNSGSSFNVTGGNGQVYVTSPAGDSLNVSGTGSISGSQVIMVADGTQGATNLNLSSTATLTLGSPSFLSATSGAINITSGTIAHIGSIIFNAAGTIPVRFSPRTGITQVNPPTTPPTPSGVALYIITDPLTVNGIVTGTAGPSPPSPPTGSSPGSGSNVLLFGQVTNTGSGSSDSQIGTRTATDYTPSTVYGWTNGSITGLPENAHGGPVAINAEHTGSSNFNQATVSGLHGVHPGAGTNGNFFNLDVGNMVFNPQTNITVGTHEGNVFIDGGSIAFVMETGHDVAVYDLHDTHSGAVRVKAGTQTITLHPGQQVVLTHNSTADFDKINPGGKISYRNSKSQDMGGGVKAFLADFSVPTALTTVAPLKQMLTSTNKDDRKIAHQLLKNAVVLNETTSANGPYRNGL